MQGGKKVKNVYYSWTLNTFVIHTIDPASFLYLSLLSSRSCTPTPISIKYKSFQCITQKRTNIFFRAVELRKAV